MKYNPKINEKVAATPEFAAAHPMLGDEHVQGNLRLMYELQEYLGTITGLPGVSVAGRIVDLGLTDYASTYALQLERVEKRRYGSARDDLILVTEHPGTFTLGRRGGRQNLMVSEQFLHEKNIALVHIERGGDITYHGRSQLVIYPILHLRQAGLTVTDGGASLFAKTIKKIRERSPKTLVEVLIPDLQGNWQALKTILDAAPDVLNHNIETVPGLYPEVRPQAEYERSLELLRRAKELNCKIPTKTGIMLGLGETLAEIETTWHDLLAVGCDILTMGQYLQPSDNHLTVKRFVPPEEFDDLEEKAVALGFAGVASGPFVRSSYQAEKLYRRAVKRIQLAGVVLKNLLML